MNTPISKKLKVGAPVPPVTAIEPSASYYAKQHYANRKKVQPAEVHTEPTPRKQAPNPNAVNIEDPRLREIVKKLVREDAESEDPVTKVDHKGYALYLSRIGNYYNNLKNSG